MDNDIPWRKIGFSALFVVLILLGIIFHHRLGDDFWPLDSSRVGPNLVASVVTWTTIGVIAYLIWPPTRERIHAFLDRKFHLLHKKVDALGESHKQLHERHDQHHEHLQSLTDEISTLRDDILAHIDKRVGVPKRKA